MLDNFILAISIDVTDPEKGGPGFCVQVLRHYISMFDFTGQEFDDAIRLFLSGFRLPGEAQKIDRIMEVFSERYSHQNEDVFPSADTAFVLAFSIIMLNTDLHNPSIKVENRMSLDGFIRNNRGIAMNGEDLPSSFLEGIYNRIKSKPFSLKEDDEARAVEAELFPNNSTYFFDFKNFFGSDDDKRKEEMRRENEVVMNSSYQLFKEKKSISNNTTSISDLVDPSEAVVPMFDAIWGPLLSALSTCLEQNDERNLSLCLNGFVYAIRIAAHCKMDFIRDAFVNSLTKFTTLGSIKEMKQSNIESIRVLLSIAVMDGEVLNQSWGPIIQCISEVARLREVASGISSDTIYHVPTTVDELETIDNRDQDEKEIQLDQTSSFFRQSYEQNKVKPEVSLSNDSMM